MNELGASSNTSYMYMKSELSKAILYMADLILDIWDI